jgi:GH25 family lysozyme M1 (1,4-beta-N-acetylmuramidase)
MSIKGIDIASHQGPNFPFRAAKDEGYVFAFIKASGGHTYKNEYRGAQVANARAAGVLVGFYHYLFEPTNGGGDIRREAQNFIDAVRPYVRPGTTFWLDVEEFPKSVGFDGDLGGAIDLWCEIVGGEFGCNVGIYCATWYIDPAGLAGDLRLTKRPYWMASWQAEPPAVGFMRPWKAITVWQYDAFGPVGGRQPIDEDLFFGSIEELAALGVPPEVAAATLDPWAYLKQPYGPADHTVHPWFHGDYSLQKYGYPLGPAAEYGIRQADGALVKSGMVFQLFENGVWSSNGRGEPKAEAAGQVIAHMTGKQLAEWPEWVPLVAGQG